MNTDRRPETPLRESEVELLDSGNRRKLERFGSVTLSRPCAPAIWRPRLPAARWESADAVFDREEGRRWRSRDRLPREWTARMDGIRFKLSGTDFGHLGVFPEQRPLWSWMEKVCGRADRPICVLNLFAYSGGATLALARAGAEVCHLDASRGMVDWARDNAALNGFQDRPIRWIVEDVMKFLGREARRERRYDAVVLDPPSFGRGRGGEMFKIEEHLPEALALCARLLSDRPVFFLLSAHTPGFTPIALQTLLRQALPDRPGRWESGEMLLTGAPEVAPVPSGAFARWEAE